MSEVEEMKIKDILEEVRNVDCFVAAKEILSWLHNNVENYVDNKTKLYKIDLVIDSDEMPMTKKLQDLYMAIPDDSEIPDEILKSGDIEAMNKCGASAEMDKASDCRRSLDKVVEKVFNEIENAQEETQALFIRLIFFYEQIIMNPENKKRAIEIDEELKVLIEGKEDAPDKEKKKIQEKIVKLLEEGEELVKYEEFEGAVSITKFDYEAFSVGVKLSAKEHKYGEDGEIIEGKAEVVKEYIIPEGFVIWMEMNYKLKQRPASIF